MSSTDILKELPRLNEAQRRRALEIKAGLEALEAEFQELLRQPGKANASIDLRARGISETQAAELRARLKSFAEDWERPETAVYDEDPSR